MRILKTKFYFLLFAAFMLLNEDDKAITARIVQGDTEAENYLFSCYKERINFLVRARLRGRASKEDHEDIISEIQQAMLISLRKGGFNPDIGKPLEAYIAGIAGNIIGQYFRKLKREKTKVDIDSYHNIENTQNTLSDIIDAERREKLRSCLKRLKKKYKEVLLLRIYEDKSIEEISEQLKLERRRVSERINYAFKLLLKECKKENYFQ
jgi:RNA polymerase sigma factor (sigma-70 family)